MKGTLAIEAAKSGNIDMSLMICKELYAKHRDATTGAILSQVAQEISRFAHDHLSIFDSSSGKVIIFCLCIKRVSHELLSPRMCQDFRERPLLWSNPKGFRVKKCFI